MNLRSSYNGNIAHLVTSIEGFAVQGTAYKYDQLQRLKSMRVFRTANMATTNSWASATETQEYQNSYTYDLNGNLKTLLRNGYAATGLSMDNFTYNYLNLSGNASNRLGYVADAATNHAGYDDIKPGMSAGNYTYDKLGALVKDSSEGIQQIQWYRGSKKIQKIVRNDAGSDEVEFVYNPFGIRVLKIVKPRVDGELLSDRAWRYIYYGLDANGQQMALYESRPLAFNTPVVLKEQPIYGAARIGTIHPEKMIYASTSIPAESSQNTLGAKNYELTNYLGNVNAVITDRKTPTLKAPTITDQVGISVSGGVITQTEAAIGWGSAAGASVEQIHQGGYVEWTLGGTTPEDNQLIMVGLSYTNTSAHYYTINNIWHTNSNGVAYIYEMATARGSFGTYAPGDVFRIERKCDSIVYYFKGIRRRAVADPQPLAPMIVDFAMNAQGKSIYKLEIQSGTAYEAVAIMKADYYPFGMTMPGRNENSTAYRYGYNGMEKDDEVKGDGNSYSTEFRQYDPRLGRWLSLDPLMHQFPSLSPYCAFDNNPILFTDPFGLSAGDPIKMSGDRSFNDKKADKNEMLQLPDNPTEGQVVMFVYNNGKNTTESSWTYASNQEGGRWEKGVTKSNGGSWGEGQYVGIEEVNNIKLIAKIEQPIPKLNNQGLGNPINAPRDQAGNESKPSSSISSSTPTKKKVVVDGNGKPRLEEKKIETNDHPKPPSVMSKAEFKLRDDWFEKGYNRDQAHSTLRDISNYLKENSTQTFVVHIYIASGGTGTATDKVGGGFLQPGPETQYSGKNLSALAYGRFLTVQSIIMNQSGLKNVNLIYKPHFNGTEHMFKVVPQK